MCHFNNVIPYHFNIPLGECREVIARQTDTVTSKAVIWQQVCTELRAPHLATDV